MAQKPPVSLPGIRNITISGRMGTGQSTLALRLSEVLGWKMLDGGKLFRAYMKEIGESVVNSEARPDSFDLDYEKRITAMLREESHHIIQSHLAGFDAQGIEGLFKVLLVCEDAHGNDKTEVRVDRLVNRDGVSVEDAKHEVKEREEGNLRKWRRLYVNNDENWVNWDKKYYDLIVNTYSHNKEESVDLVLKAVGYTQA